MLDLLHIAIEAALKAGEEILSVYNSNNFDVEVKEDQSPLTLADKKANAVIINLLAATQIPILSEEEKALPYSERQQWHQLWIVDPLDGTKEFIKRNGEFTVNIALVEEGVPILGVVYVPVTGVLYFAEKGNGSFRVSNTNVGEISEMINRSKRLPLPLDKKKYTVVASRSHLSQETKDYITALNKDVDLILSGSSIKICLVAEGSADCYPRFAPTMEWDTAAGHAIALYAGKQVWQSDEKASVVYNKEDLLNPWFIVK